MTQSHPNQEHARKRGRGKTKVVDDNQPSKAPGQDQPTREMIGEDPEPTTHGYVEGEQQGISNRPSNEEHAFPDSDVQRSEELEVNTFIPGQQGGNRGGA